MMSEKKPPIGTGGWYPDPADRGEASLRDDDEKPEIAQKGPYPYVGADLFGEFGEETKPPIGTDEPHPSSPAAES
jgi:hypothetical protein